MKKREEIAIWMTFAAVFLIIAVIIGVAIAESVKMAEFEAEVGHVRWMGNIAQAAWRARSSL